MRKHYIERTDERGNVEPITATLGLDLETLRQSATRLNRCIPGRTYQVKALETPDRRKGQHHGGATW